MDRRTTPRPLLARRRWLGAAVATALLGGALPPLTWAQPEAAGPRVPVAEATRRPVGQALLLDATIEAQQQATLAAQASGRIVQLHVKAGDRVRAGQVLAVIDDRETGVQFVEDPHEPADLEPERPSLLHIDHPGATDAGTVGQLRLGQTTVPTQRGHGAPQHGQRARVEGISGHACHDIATRLPRLGIALTHGKCPRNIFVAS